VAHLPVVLHGTSAEVGPLVQPGTGPCLRCLDLTRTDHDPGWPAVLAQLTPTAVGPVAEASGETSLVFATAGLAAMAALGALDGHPPEPGTSWRLGLPVPRLTEQVWPRHPDCGCAGAEAERKLGPERGSPPASATMAG
jgi:bacteriocin biosynthesis cyclodehydratase domain-containing protein